MWEDNVMRDGMQMHRRGSTDRDLGVGKKPKKHATKQES